MAPRLPDPRHALAADAPMTEKMGMTIAAVHWIRTAPSIMKPAPLRVLPVTLWSTALNA